MKNFFIITHKNIILNNGPSKILFRIPFIFYQCAINCVVIPSKKSSLQIRSISRMLRRHLYALALRYHNEQLHFQDFVGFLGKSGFSCSKLDNTA